MHKSIEDIKKELNQLSESLESIALEDNQITEDEQAILDLVLRGITTLESQHLEILQTDLDDEEYKEIVLDFLRDLLYNAMNKAKEDGVVTPDEEKLLNKLESFIEKGEIF